MNGKRSKPDIRRLWLVQLGVTLLLAGFFAWAYNSNAAKSALLGGMVCIIPNAYFALKLFKHQGARAAKQIVNSFYKAEALKIILSIFLFTAVFVLCRITPLAFFVSYIVVQTTHWLAPWIIVTKQNGPESD
ncbi:MAG: ATP synthase subunit I [Legionellales bacterium]